MFLVGLSLSYKHENPNHFKNLKLTFGNLKLNPDMR